MDLKSSALSCMEEEFSEIQTLMYHDADVGQEPQLAHAAAKYLHLSMPALFANGCINCVLQRYLQAQVLDLFCLSQQIPRDQMERVEQLADLKVESEYAGYCVPHHSCHWHHCHPLTVLHVLLHLCSGSRP